MKTPSFAFLLCLLLFLTQFAKAQSNRTSKIDSHKKSGAILLKMNVPKTTTPYAKTVISAILFGSFENPFNQFEIALDLQIVSPSGAKFQHPFYFDRSIFGLSIWKTHWAPRELGTYKVSLLITQEGKAMKKSAEYSLLVEEEVGSEPQDGFLSTTDASFWTLEFESGKKFRGIGINLAWEPRPDVPFDIQSYTYDFLIPLYKEKGMNMISTWMCPWNLPLEWKITAGGRYPNDTTNTYNQFAIQRMDFLVNLLEENKMYAKLTLDYFGALSTKPDEFGNPAFWPRNNYNVNLGGPATTPEEFFTLEAAKQQYKNRLRYIISRWGYSPYIPIVEFWDEIDNVINDGNINAAKVVDWHKEMSAYWKSTDNAHSHILTTSISDSLIAGLFTIPDIQLSQEHLYGQTGTIHEVVNKYNSMFNKPFIVGEFSVNSQRGPSESSLPTYDRDLRTGLWFGVFSPTPIYPLTWWWQDYTQLDTLGSFAPSVQITEQMLSAGQGTFEGFEVTKGQNVNAFGVQTGNSYWVYIRNFLYNEITVKANFPLEDTSPYKIMRYNTITQEYTVLTTLSPVDNVLFLPPLLIDELTEIIILAQKVME
ncbi:hypothetical protein [Xanthovirga aplysinae]|uniref:hypothetical protein n=1 Tax=Xanthovirga aplysinae TaxID=2529853 RepID=UPI0012BB8821|nr:hypothetical protein [Xanthovirga aplysinae]MTI32401.1 hypothetical protein [Xanthovirga aplysinae]